MNPYVIDSYNKEDIDLIEKQIFGKLMHLKDLKDYDYKKYKLLKKSFLYIKFEYLEEWLNLIDVLLENNKGYIINYILEYLKKLNTTLPLNSILEIINNLDLETEDKELIKNNIIKYGFNKEDLSLKKQIKKL